MIFGKQEPILIHYTTVSSGSTATAYRFCKLQCNKIVIMSKLGGQSQTVVKHLKNIYLLFLNFLLSLSSVLQQLLYEKQWSTQFDFSWNWVDLQGHSKVSFIRHLHVNIKIEYQSKAVNLLNLLNFCKNLQTNKNNKKVTTSIKIRTNANAHALEILKISCVKEVFLKPLE